jgi:cytosine/adenosine deaminase-related metal-dependent hydrolase
MHLAESREELELIRDGTGPFKVLLEERSMWDAEAIPRGSRPLDYLRMLAQAPNVLVVHGNYLDDEELEFLGAQRAQMTLVFCPRTHSYFFHPPYPLGAAIAAGVRVALGTDSRASNPDLSVLSELRHVARTHPEIKAHNVLRMGTLAGAEALSRDRFVGSITPGKFANFVAVPIPEHARGSPDDVLAAILADDSTPSAVYLAGRRL